MVVKLSVKEVLIELELVRRVKELGGRCDKVEAVSGRGFFDRIVLLPGGRVMFVELKRPQGGRLSEHQKKYRDDYQALGAVVALVKSYEDIDLLLN